MSARKKKKLVLRHQRRRHRRRWWRAPDPSTVALPRFVDPVNGNDENDGRTPETAFRTLKALSAAYNAEPADPLGINVVFLTELSSKEGRTVLP